jgi:hypothetical protein
VEGALTELHAAGAVACCVLAAELVQPLAQRDAAEPEASDSVASDSEETLTVLLGVAPQGPWFEGWAEPAVAKKRWSAIETLLDYWQQLGEAVAGGGAAAEAQAVPFGEELRRRWWQPQAAQHAEGGREEREEPQAAAGAGAGAAVSANLRDRVFGVALPHDWQLEATEPPGLACTLFSDKEQHKLAKLEALLEQPIAPERLPPQSLLKTPGYKPPMVSLEIGAGKKQKLRPGDILGALTGDNGMDGKQVGKITLYDNWSCVAVRRNEVHTALEKLGRGKMKGRSFRVRRSAVKL